MVNLGGLIEELGYCSTSSASVFKSILSQFPSSSLKPLTIAKLISMMVRTHTGHTSNATLQTSLDQTGSWWFSQNKDGKGQESKAESTCWLVENVVDVIKELNPSLDWREVAMCLDHEGFIIKDEAGLRLLVSIFQRAEEGGIQCDCVVGLVWKNTEGQLSVLKRAIIANPDIMPLT
eukprot:Pgem_evm1s635